MSKSIKLTENNYIDSSGVVHKRTTLDKMFNGESSIGNIIVDDINSKNLFKLLENRVNYLCISVINEDTLTITSTGVADGYVTTNYIKLYEGKTYTVSFKSSGAFKRLSIFSDDYTIYRNLSTTTNTLTFTMLETRKISLGFYVTGGSGNTLTITDIQIEESISPTSYSNYIDFNALKGGGWNDIALINTYNYYDATTYNKLQYKKVSNEVFIRGMLTNSVANPQGYYAACGTLPEECCPRKIAYLIADETGEVCDCVVQPNGEIRVYNKKANNWISLDSIRFFID